MGLVLAKNVKPGMRVRHPKEGTFIVRSAETEGDAILLVSQSGGYYRFWPDSELQEG